MYKQQPLEKTSHSRLPRTGQWWSCSPPTDWASGWKEDCQSEPPQHREPVRAAPQPPRTRGHAEAQLRRGQSGLSRVCVCVCVCVCVSQVSAVCVCVYSQVSAVCVCVQSGLSPESVCVYVYSRVSAVCVCVCTIRSQP